MAVISKKKEDGISTPVLLGGVLILGVVLLFVLNVYMEDEQIESAILKVETATTLAMDDACSSISPSQLVTTNEPPEKNEKNFGRAKSPEGTTPSFSVGSHFGERAMYHMNGDSDHFALIKEQYELALAAEQRGLSDAQGQQAAGASSKNIVSLDVGANQGFFTFYIAALGAESHAIEMNPKNMLALQHGALYNKPEVSKRVHLHPIGASNSIGKFSMKGGVYDGFLVPNEKSGTILSLPLDCFVAHFSQEFAAHKHFFFLKIDVEGYEIAALKSAQKTILSQDNPELRPGSLLMEVGPDRWNRCGVSLEEGIAEMANTASRFQHAYLLTRPKDPPKGTCNPSIVTKAGLSNTEPTRQMDKTNLHLLTQQEWKPLMTAMQQTKMDCNFWFTNQ